MKTKKQTSIYLYKEDLEKYERLYPRTLSTFIIKAINLAMKDKEIFYKIFTNNENGD